MFGKRKVRGDSVNNAIETLKGYCNKHTNCNGCKFHTEGRCMFGTMYGVNNVIPADWVYNKETDKWQLNLWR